MSDCHVDAAAHAQDVSPVKNLCAFLNAFHVYASDTKRFVETNHYCSHVSEDLRQCILYDAPGPNARLIGVEYMITPKLFDTLPVEEKHLWHSHVFEVKSGMLIMPKPEGASQSAWEVAETKEMVEVVKLYGKVYHLWQTDRGDELPLGTPQLMTSFTHEGEFDFDKYVGKRDKRFDVDYKRKRELRKDIEEPEIDKDADWAWKQ